jgi:hypothetical protein
LAPSAAPVPPIIGPLPRPDALSSSTTTPDPCSAICRAAALAVWKEPVIPCTGLMKSAAGICSSGVPWTSPRPATLNDTSSRPVSATTRDVLITERSWMAVASRQRIGDSARLSAIRDGHLVAHRSAGSAPGADRLGAQTESRVGRPRLTPTGHVTQSVCPVT